MKKAIAKLVVLCLILSVFTAGIPVSADDGVTTLSAANNRYLKENFNDGTYDSSLITMVMGGASKLSVENGTLKIAHTGGDNIRYRINAKNAFANAPAGKAGKLTYDFDIKVINNTGDSNRAAVARDVTTNWGTATSFITVKADLAFCSPTNTIATGGTTTVGEWCNVKIVFNYSNGTPTFDVFVNGIEAASDKTIANSYDPYDNGIGFATYANNNGLSYYIDNLTISYIEVYPELISGISIAGMEVESFDANTLNYTVDVPENAFETLSENDITVAFADGFTEDNTTVTKSISQTGNTKLVNIALESGVYTASYSVLCNKVMEPSAAYNGTLTEDFDVINSLDGHGFISSTGGVTEIVEEEGRGNVLYRTYPESGNHNVRTYIDASSLAGAERKLGVLTYEFDIKVLDGSDGTNGVSKGGYSVSYGFHIKSGDSFAGRVHARYNKVSIDGQGEVATNADDWNKIKIVYDYSGTALTYDVYVNGVLFKEGLTESTYDAFDKMLFQFWGAANGRKLQYYIDNVKIAYIEALPEIVTSLSIAGEEVADFDSNDFDYNIDIYEELYDELSADDVSVSVNTDYADSATITKTVTETFNKKSITIAVESGIYTCTYKISCTRVQRPAEINIENYEINKDKRISFSGTVSSNIGTALSRPIAVIARAEGDADITESKGIKVISSDSNGEFSGEMLVYDDESVPKLYTMDIIFDVFGASEPLTKQVTYINEKQLESSIEYLKSSSNAVFNYMVSADNRYSISATNNKEIFNRLGIWIDKYESAGTDKSAMDTAVASYKSTLTKENIIKVANGSIAAVVLSNSGVSAADAVALIEKVDEEVMPIKVGETGFGGISSQAKEWVVENARTNNSADGFATWEDLNTEIRKSILLDITNNALYTDMEDLFLNNTELLNDPMTELRQETDQDVVDAAMKDIELKALNSDFTKVEDLVGAIKKALNDNKGIGGNNGTNNGIIVDSPYVSLGGGGGSFGGGKTPTNDANTNNKSEVSNKIFKDVEGFEWAENAIEELNKKGVVSGVGDGRFEPNRNVLREEFVKLLCEAFDIEAGTNEAEFEDVNAEDWFKKYVSVAVDKGIINGVSATMFGTGRNITREDMAVMIYRTLLMMGAELSVGAETFADSDDFAEYAVDAINALSNAGIINGVGDNRFAPKAAATRAETAVIIFRCVEKFSH